MSESAAETETSRLTPTQLAYSLVVGGTETQVSTSAKSLSSQMNLFLSVLQFPEQQLHWMDEILLFSACRFPSSSSVLETVLTQTPIRDLSATGVGIRTSKNVNHKRTIHCNFGVSRKRFKPLTTLSIMRSLSRFAWSPTRRNHNTCNSSETKGEEKLKLLLFFHFTLAIGALFLLIISYHSLLPSFICYCI